MPPVPYSRRSFLETAASGLAALVALPPALERDPYGPWLARSLALRSNDPVRVRGVVRAAGRGLARVALSDGLRVVETGPDGRFDLVTEAERGFVSLSLPAGYAVPTSATGTARLHRPITPDGRGEMRAAFDLTPLPDGRSDARHACLLLADVQTQDAQEMRWFHEQTVPDVRTTIGGLARETFGIACGDIMFDHLELYPDYERGVKDIGVPFFQVIGNHDLDQDGRTDEASTVTFSRHFGPGHYSFDRGEVHYVVLDDVFWHGAGYFGYLGAEQLTWLAADLARVERGRTVIVALHIPVLGTRHLREGERRPGVSVSVNNREALYRLLEPYRAHILSGHTHEHEHVFEHGAHEHVSGTVCGAWWSGPICGDGTPNGYTVLEVDGSRVTWRYKCTGLGADHQIRAYPRGADPQASSEIVANVWDWDPEWTVTWFENGERRGSMARRVGRDPLSVELHTGPERPPRRKWVEPYPTGHLFYAPVGAGAGALRVEARDRFGRTYTTDVPATS